MSTNAEQPPPVPNASRPIWEMVIDDMRERNQLGIERYGTPLQAGNGRDPLVDAYQESLDKTVYLRQELEERRLRGEQRYLDRIEEQRKRMQARIDELETVLRWLDRCGGLGHDKHAQIARVLPENK